MSDMGRSSVTIQYSPDGESGEDFIVTACAGTSDEVTLDALEATASKAFYKAVASAIQLYTAAAKAAAADEGD